MLTPDLQDKDQPEHITNDSAARRVVDIALPHFANRGFESTKLKDIADESGMSKRMLHYHFVDKRGLYQAALAEAIDRLHPNDEHLQVESTVPAEGVRKLIDSLFMQYQANPDAVKLIVRENLDRVLDLRALPQFADESAPKLYVDRLLLAGQDAGAFRPGISADDIFALISAISFYRITNVEITENLFEIDFEDEANIAGLHRLTLDTVLSFLTSNIPDTGSSSYLYSHGGTADTDDTMAQTDDPYAEG